MPPMSRQYFENFSTYQNNYWHYLYSLCHLGETENVVVVDDDDDDDDDISYNNYEMINDYYCLFIYGSWSCHSVELSLQLSGSSFLMHSIRHWKTVWIWRVLFSAWLCDGLSECTEGCAYGYPHLFMLHIETRLFSCGKCFFSLVMHKMTKSRKT